MAQLMRLFVYVADSTLQAALNIRVHPAPSPCPQFQPHVEGPVVLHPGLWVIRFPYPLPTKVLNRMYRYLGRNLRLFSSQVIHP
jgi:hypothetical protein